jgi:V8-like Glu-specific endopeptidase
MKNLMKVFSGMAVLLSLPVFASADAKSIYGADDRKDYFQVSSEMKGYTDSVVSLWRSARVVDQGSSYRLQTFTLRDAKGLCPGQKFAEQNVGAFCSGSLVGEDLIMTAGHCIKSEADCANTKFVFGHRVEAAGKAGVSNVAKDQVYGCSKIVTRKLDEGVLGSDYALIKLDRKVAGRKPLAINRGGQITKGAKLFVIGHPSGLPVKVAGNSSVRKVNDKYFVADLDTFGGNSGSAVFNASTKKIEGILVRGDEDYSETPAGCTVATTYAQTGGRGEDVTRISELSAFIPRPAGEKPQYIGIPYEYYVTPRDNTYVAPPVIPINPFR